MIKAIPHSAYREQSALFHERYVLYDFTYVGDHRYSKRSLKNYKTRTCRFCGLSYPAVKFSNFSHLLPQLIGNTNLYSDFECDACNALFSGFEDDLAAYFGLSRSIVGLQGQKRAPGFAARGMKVKSKSFVGNNILILAPEDFVVNGASITFSYTKNKYVPANVYKALLKSALSLLDEDEVKRNYKKAIAYLCGKIKLTRGALIAGYNLPFTKNLPLHVYCFKKRNENDQIPKHVMCFNFQNHMISFPIPIENSQKSEDVDDWETIFSPPYFVTENLMKAVFPVPFMNDLTSTVEVSNEEESMTIQMAPEDLKNVWAYDPAADVHKQEDLDLSQSKHIIMIKDAVHVDPKQLSEFLHREMDTE